MKTSTSFRSTLAALVVGVAIGGSASAQGSPVQWLVVVQGEVARTSGDRMRLLTQDSAIAFSDRPERQVNLISLSKFAAAWGPGGTFEEDAPNASLVNETQGQLGVLEVIGVEWQAGLFDIRFVVLDGTLPLEGDRIAITFDTFTEDEGGGGYQED